MGFAQITAKRHREHWFEQFRVYPNLLMSQSHSVAGACVAEQERSEILSRLRACLSSQAGSPDLGEKGVFY